MAELATGAAIVNSGGVWSWPAPLRLIRKYDPGLLARVTTKVVVGVRVALRSSEKTFWLKSEGTATWVLLTVMVAEETRSVPSASPLWICKLKGDPTHAGTCTVVV